MAEVGTKVIFVRAEASLHRTLKVSAAVSGLTLQDLVLGILRTHVQQQGPSDGATLIFTEAAPTAPAIEASTV
jgi:hypothetical protein